MSFTALIGVIAALCGTAVGGLITYFTNRDLKKTEWKLSVLREEINDRKRLYSDFLAEAYRLTLISFQTKYNDLKEFDILNRYYAQIELLAADKIVETAKAIIDNVIDGHSENNVNPEKLFFDVKRNFIHEVKKELFQLKNS